MKRNRMTRWIKCALVASASLLLGGCAMGGATGTKTVQGIAALEAEEYQQAKELFEDAVEMSKQAGLIKSGDTVVITAGVPLRIAGRTNMIRVVEVE